jgi:hypothetical protein
MVSYNSAGYFQNGIPLTVGLSVVSSTGLLGYALYRSYDAAGWLKGKTY